MNRYSKALKHIKSTQIEEKIKKLEESTPTNNTDNLYSTNPQGFNDGPPDPAKAFYPDQDGDWPSGIPGDEDAASYLRPPGFWTGEVNWDTIHTANVSQDEIGSDGKSTAGVIADDGTVKTILPENTRDFILGPLVDGYVPNHTYDAYTNIGYLQKDTRQFVLLGRITGQWKAGLYNPGVAVWDGGADDFTSYNDDFTLAHAQWFQAEVVANNYVTNAPYFYSGGVPQQNLSGDQCPTCPSGMKGGVMPGGGGGGNSASGDSGGAGWGTGGTPDIGSDRSPGTSGNAGDVGLWGLVYDQLKKLGKSYASGELGVKMLSQKGLVTGKTPFEKVDYMMDTLDKGVAGLNNVIDKFIPDATQKEVDKRINSALDWVVDNIVEPRVGDAKTASDVLQRYDDYMQNPTGERQDLTSDLSSKDINAFKSSVKNRPINMEKNVQKFKELPPGKERDRVKDSIRRELERSVNAVSQEDRPESIGNSLGKGIRVDVDEYINNNKLVMVKSYEFRPIESANDAHKITARLLGTSTDTTATNMAKSLATSLAAKLLLRPPDDGTNRNYTDNLENAPGMPWKVEIDLGQQKSQKVSSSTKNDLKDVKLAGLNKIEAGVMIDIIKGGKGNVQGAKDTLKKNMSPANYQKLMLRLAHYEPQGQVISESRKIKILREVKKPYKMPEIPKQKYKMNFSGKYSAQNTPDKTASKVTDALIASGNDKGHRWRTQDKYWQGYETTERMNIVYDKLGHAEQAWNMITEKNGWKDREMQEHLNILAHEKQMLKENPLYESPFYVVEDNEPQSYEKDPLYKKVKDKLNKELHYKDRPSVKGYPNEPPPEMVNGWHPKFGKRYKYDKLDPQSAEAMPDTGDPEIDANIEKATDKKAKTRKSKVLAGKTEQFSNWRDDLTDA